MATCLSTAEPAAGSWALWSMLALGSVLVMLGVLPKSAAMAGDEVQQRKINTGLGKYWEGINTNTSWTKECRENFR